MGARTKSAPVPHPGAPGGSRRVCPPLSHTPEPILATRRPHSFTLDLKTPLQGRGLGQQWSSDPPQRRPRNSLSGARRALGGAQNSPTSGGLLGRRHGPQRGDGCGDFPVSTFPTAAVKGHLRHLMTPRGPTAAARGRSAGAPGAGRDRPGLPGVLPRRPFSPGTRTLPFFLPRDHTQNCSS